MVIPDIEKQKDVMLLSYMLGPLHSSLIEYMAKASRFIYLEHPLFLKDFHKETKGMFSYLNETFIAEQLYEKILPDIFMYTMSDYQRAMLELLDLHPFFYRINNGYLKTRPDVVEEDPQYRLDIELKQKEIYEQYERWCLQTQLQAAALERSKAINMQKHEYENFIRTAQNH